MRKYEIAVVSKNGYARTVRIYAPKKADRAVIMHDGQNAFYDSDASYGKSWRTLDALKSLGIKNTAVIGVDSTAMREDDYLPFPTDPELGKIRGGNAKAYMDFIDDGLLPYLDKRFSFKLYGMIGSSLGALATLFYAARNNKKFTAYGLLSTPMFVSAKAYDDFLESATFDTDSFYEIYVGGNERYDGSDKISDLYVGDAFRLTKALREHGVKKLRLNVENEGVHDENCWREPHKRFLAEFAKIVP